MLEGMRWVVLASVVVPALAVAKPVWRPSVEPSERVARAAAAELAVAIKAHDAGAIAKQLALPLTVGPLWFPDAGCTKRFGAGGLVLEKDAPVLARCLAKLDLEMSTRKSSLRDGAVLTAKPGFEIEVAFLTQTTRKVRWLGSPAHEPREVAQPMLTAQAFEALRTHGTTLLDAAVAGELAGELGTRDAVSAWLRVCLDATGAIRKTTVVGATTTKAGDVFVRAAADWRFRPFHVRGAATPACALSLLTYPAAEAPAVEALPATDVTPVTTTSVELDDFVDGTFDVWGAPPPPPPPPRPASISVRTLESLRRRGTSRLTPDAQAKRELGARKTITVAKVCIDATGAVASAKVIRSSGAKAWDAQIEREARRWSFSPYVSGGAPQAACAVMTFAP